MGVLGTLQTLRARPCISDAAGGALASALQERAGPYGLFVDYTDQSIAIDDTGGLLTHASQGRVSSAGALLGPGTKFVYTSPDAKICRQQDGQYLFQAHNLYLNSASPANQSVTVISGAPYAVTITGTVSVTASGAASGTWTAGTRTFTAATTTLTLGSTSGAGTVHIRRTPSISSYVATAGAPVYDLPYQWNAAGVSRLRLEEARQNILLNSTTLATQSVTVTAQVYTLSFFGTGTVTLSGASTAGPLVGTSDSEPVELTFTPTAGTLTLTVSGTVSMANLEAGNKRTSWVPTYGAARTRQADNISIATSQFPLGSEFTVFVDFEADDVAVTNQTVVALVSATLNDYAYLYQNSGTPIIRTRSGGGSTFDTSLTSHPLTAGVRRQITFRIKTGAVAASVDGSSVAAGQSMTAVAPTGITTLSLGSWFSSSRLESGHIRRLAVIPTAASNAEIADKFYERATSSTAYDIFAVAGQSNTNSGTTLDSMIDVSGGHVWQFNQNTTAVTAADEPLLHIPQVAASIGFALPFARDYYHPNVGADVLLLPCGVGNTGYMDNRWNPGNDLYNRLESTIAAALAQHPNGTLKGILWMQGERECDVPWTELQYSTAFDAMVAGLRATFPDVKIVVGGLSPGYVAANVARQPVADAIIDAPNRLTGVAYADPATPSDITGGSPVAHYTAAQQRSFAARWWSAWQTL